MAHPGFLNSDICTVCHNLEIPNGGLTIMPSRLGLQINYALLLIYIFQEDPGLEFCFGDQYRRDLKEFNKTFSSSIQESSSEERPRCSSCDLIKRIITAWIYTKLPVTHIRVEEIHIKQTTTGLLDISWGGRRFYKPNSKSHAVSLEAYVQEGRCN